MPRPTRGRTAGLALADELAREYEDNAIRLLLICANRPVEDWPVAGWTHVYGDPVSPEGLVELQQCVRIDLDGIARKGIAGFVRGPSDVRLTWWHEPRSVRGRNRLAPHARGGLIIEVASKSLDEYLDWAIVLLLLRDAGRLRCCHGCGSYFLADRERGKGIYCADDACRRARKATAASRRRASRRRARELTNLSAVRRRR